MGGVTASTLAPLSQVRFNLEAMVFPINSDYIEFPWDKLPTHTTVCDVGGGIGAISMQLLKKHPHLRIKLQDTPERIKQAKDDVWPKMCPEAFGSDDRSTETLVEFKTIDFLKESPIKDCDVYFMKNIM